MAAVKPGTSGLQKLSATSTGQQTTINHHLWTCPLAQHKTDTYDELQIKDSWLYKAL